MRHIYRVLGFIFFIGIALGSNTTQQQYQQPAQPQYQQPTQQSQQSQGGLGAIVKGLNDAAEWVKPPPSFYQSTQPRQPTNCRTTIMGGVLYTTCD